jgi:hypothetical protein
MTRRSSIRKRKQTKGIFCLEGLWDSDLRDTSTVRPLLELLRLNANVEYIHREYATREEFELYVRKWTLKRYDAYPILYLASHGAESGIEIGGELYPLDDLGVLLEDRCANRVILFASCSTLNIDKRHLRDFLERTKALAVAGYKVDVGWMRATAFELLLLYNMQLGEFSGRGIGAIEKKARAVGREFRDLDFRMETIKDLT